jgi:hypothetical protein
VLKLPFDPTTMMLSISQTTRSHSSRRLNYKILIFLWSLLQWKSITVQTFRVRIASYYHYTTSRIREKDAWSKCNGEMLVFENYLTKYLRTKREPGVKKRGLYFWGMRVNEISVKYKALWYEVRGLNVPEHPVCFLSQSPNPVKITRCSAVKIFE